MEKEHLRARIRRLEQVKLGFAREQLAMREGNDPLYRTERLAYLEALDEVLRALERARMTLVNACLRMEGRAMQ